MLLTFGNCQVGKSSFINTIKGSEIAKVGGWGEAVTTATHFHQIGPSSLLFRSDPSDYRLSIIDIQGLNDSNLSRSDAEILSQIRMKLFEENCSELAGILIFDSAMASTAGIRRVLNTALQLFGPNMMASVIGITCKWDELSEGEVAVRSKTYEDMRDIRIIKWQNNTEEERVSQEKMDLQMHELTQALAGIRPYQVNEIKEMENECKRIAEVLRAKDPNRYSVTYENYVDMVVENYKEDEEYKEIVMKFTDEDSIKRRAYELQQAAGTHPVNKSRVVPTQQLQSYMDVETRHIQRSRDGDRRYGMFGPREKITWTETQQVPVQRQRYVTVNTTQNYVEQEYYPVENYRQAAMAETHEVSKTRKVDKQRMKNVPKKREIKVEKFDFSHYLSQARLQMINENKRLASL